ncbi:MAG: hypothetical protein EBW51_08960 [Actinobacteria bacterium]|nr:hypothetical protein [Actinomycetota bacterium]
MQYGPKIVTNGLVFYVNAADRKSYAGTGTTWQDISTNGLSGSSCLKGSPSPAYSSSNGGYLSTGAFNSGKYFDWGTNISAVDFTSSNFTIMVMFLPNSASFSGRTLGLFGYGRVFLRGYYMLISKTAASKLSFMTNGTGGGSNQQETRSSDFSVYSGKWVFLTVVRNGTSVRIYANTTQTYLRRVTCCDVNSISSFRFDESWINGYFFACKIRLTSICISLISPLVRNREPIGICS